MPHVSEGLQGLQLRGDAPFAARAEPLGGTGQFLLGNLPFDPTQLVLRCLPSGAFETLNDLKNLSNTCRSARNAVREMYGSGYSDLLRRNVDLATEIFDEWGGYGIDHVGLSTVGRMMTFLSPENRRRAVAP